MVFTKHQAGSLKTRLCRPRNLELGFWIFCHNSIVPPTHFQAFSCCDTVNRWLDRRMTQDAPTVEPTATGQTYTLHTTNALLFVTKEMIKNQAEFKENRVTVSGHLANYGLWSVTDSDWTLESFVITLRRTQKQRDELRWRAGGEDTWDSSSLRCRPSSTVSRCCIHRDL